MRNRLLHPLSRAILTAVLLVGTALSAMPYAVEVDGIYYNLSGVRVDRPTKGVYIMNGKKVIIK